MPKKIDLTGRRFGRLLVLREHLDPCGERGGGRRWVCRCDCGNIVTIRQNNLHNGGTRSCGCLRAESNAAKASDLSGQRFGSLTVVQQAPLPYNKNLHGWLCRCDCGNTIVTSAYKLKKGTIHSCGCKRAEDALRKIDPGGQNTLGRFKGTTISLIRDPKPYSNSTSGVRGVNYIKSTGRWKATITAQKKTIYLGVYRSLDAAVKARREAEKKYYGPLIDEFDGQTGLKED